MDLEQLASGIWPRVDRGETFPWPRSEVAWKTSVDALSILLPREKIGDIYPFHDRPLANKQLRSCLSGYLSGNISVGSEELRTALAHWIVVQWGGIRSGSGTVADWSRELGSHTPAELDAFAVKMGNHRISSWSKLLAFAEPASHAIYDARTSVALNCILQELGHDVGFHMPVGRNSKVEPARKALRKRGFQERLGYSSYVMLLKHMASASGQPDILAMEMALFANAPTIAADFTLAHAADYRA